jgi:hypothetical protein
MTELGLDGPAAWQAACLGVPGPAKGQDGGLLGRGRAGDGG